MCSLLGLLDLGLLDLLGLLGPCPGCMEYIINVNQRSRNPRPQLEPQITSC